MSNKNLILLLVVFLFLFVFAKIPAPFVLEKALQSQPSISYSNIEGSFEKIIFKNLIVKGQEFGDVIGSIHRSSLLFGEISGSLNLNNSVRTGDLSFVISNDSWRINEGQVYLNSSGLTQEKMFSGDILVRIGDIGFIGRGCVEPDLEVDTSRFYVLINGVEKPLENLDQTFECLGEELLFTIKGNVESNEFLFEYKLDNVFNSKNKIEITSMNSGLYPVLVAMGFEQNGDKFIKVFANEH